MKKISIILSTLAIVLFAAPVYAQTVTPLTFTDPGTETATIDLNGYYGWAAYGADNTQQGLNTISITDTFANIGITDTPSHILIFQDQADYEACTNITAIYTTCLSLINGAFADFQIDLTPTDDIPSAGQVKDNLDGWISIYWDFVLAVLSSLFIFALTNGVLFISIYFVLRRLHLIH